MRTLFTSFLLLLLGYAHAQSTVCDQLQAGFAVSENTTTLYFSNTTTGTGQGTQFFWNFGDGYMSQDPQPGHTYQPGTYEVCLTALTLLPGDNGQLITCLDTTCAVITINAPQCDPNFAVELAWNEGPGGQVLFTATSTEPNTWYTWYFGNQGTANGSSATWTFPEPGDYSVCVTGWYFNEATNDTCVTEDCAVITVNGNGPCAALNAEFTPFVGGFGVNLQNAVVNNDWVYLWTFGDGATGYGPNTGHQYSAPGVYDICLTVYTWDPVAQDTCFADHCAVVTIGASPCNPNFLVEMDAQAQGNDLFTFVATSTLPNTNFIWYFGDGTQAFGPTADHTYALDGTYGVCVTAWYFNEAGPDTCWAEDCELVVVQGDGPCDPNFAVELAWNAGPNNTIFLTGGSNQPNTNFIWYLGDGSEAYGPSVTHTYAEDGNYTVCLAGWYYNEATGDSCWAEECAIVTVGGDDPCDALTACFVINDLGNGAYFFDNCTGGPLGTQYFWTFGDGPTSGGTNVDHQYMASGTYEVCLTAFWQQCSDTTCTTITVNNGGDCDPNYSASFTYEVQNNAVIFFANTAEPTLGWIWTFPDGAVAYEPVHTHLFEPPGPFEVCLSTWYWNEQTQDTCWAHTCQWIDPFGIVNSVDELDESGLSVFPVPADDQLTITGLPAHATLQLFSPDGRLLRSAQPASNTHHLPVQDLASGTYLLVVEASGERAYRRVVVDRAER